jgi:hypothetical protein
MHNFESTNFDKIIVHKVGNKNSDTDYELITTTNLLTYDDEDDRYLNLVANFLKAFDGIEDVFGFNHPNHLSLNVLYNVVNQYFNDTSTFVDASVHIAKHLYDATIHPNIKSGDLFIIPFTDVLLEDELTNGLGIFKVENKNRFYKLQYQNNTSEILFDEGFTLNKLDKGCIIFNTYQEDGFRIISLDNTSPDKEANFWKDDFLQIEQKQNTAYITHEFVEMCKSFVDETEMFEDVREKNAFVRESIDYLKQNKSVNTDTFIKEVLGNQDKETQHKFVEFKESFFVEKNIPNEDEFKVSENILTREKKKIKDIIKLDNKLEIKLNGANNLIKKGFDETIGQHYYQIFYYDED